jgi:hypothetical protein
MSIEQRCTKKHALCFYYPVTTGEIQCLKDLLNRYAPSLFSFSLTYRKYRVVLSEQTLGRLCSIPPVPTPDKSSAYKMHPNSSNSNALSLDLGFIHYWASFELPSANFHKYALHQLSKFT